MEHPTPFDEKAALAELERLRDEIPEARRARQAKLDEFDRFVQGLRNPASPTPAAAPPEPGAAEAPAPEPLPPAPPPYLPVPSALAADTPARRAASQQARRPAVRALGVLAIVVVTLALVLMYWSRKAPQPPVESPAASSQPPAPSVQPPPVATPPPTVPAPAFAVSLQMRTLQTVWMRVVVDGEKQSEGMVPGGERLQFNANRAIVIRVGNGADVVVKTAKGEEPFGVAGQPATRTFAAGDARTP